VKFLREDFPRAVRALEMLHIVGDTKHPNMASLNRPDAVEHNLNHMLGHVREFNANPEIPDPETGMPHVIHAAWRALAWLEAYQREHGET
jgi:hypothetical protein